MRLTLLACTLSLVASFPSRVDACGGFFCGNAPVDQQAERIIFAVDETGTEMIVQISYRGSADEFAWVLPVPAVPDASSLETFPAQAITALDANTAPIFLRPTDSTCSPILLNGGGPDDSTPGVTVHIEQTVGPFEVAVLEGDASPVVSWLRERSFRVSESMIPLLQEYADAGMKLVALKLSADAETEDIEPIRMHFPPGPVMIPLRITAIAAEPEMGLLVFLLGDQRWGPDNWADLDIDPGTLRFAPHAWPAETDWLRRVALEADAFGGKALVTELAEPTTRLIEALRATMPTDPDQREAAEALLDLLDDYPYLTRMYGRLSPNEMDVDPVFTHDLQHPSERGLRLADVLDPVDRDSTFAARGSRRSSRATTLALRFGRRSVREPRSQPLPLRDVRCRCALHSDLDACHRAARRLSLSGGHVGAHDVHADGRRHGGVRPRRIVSHSQGRRGPVHGVRLWDGNLRRDQHDTRVSMQRRRHCHRMAA